MKMIMFLMFVILFVLYFEIVREDKEVGFISMNKQIEKSYPFSGVPFPEPQKRGEREEQFAAVAVAFVMKEPEEVEENPFKKIIEEGKMYQKKRKRR